MLYHRDVIARVPVREQDHVMKIVLLLEEPDHFGDSFRLCRNAVLNNDLDALLVEMCVNGQFSAVVPGQHLELRQILVESCDFLVAA